jgi:hypothetical protein
MNTEEEKIYEKKVFKRRKHALKRSKVSNSIFRLHEFLSIYFYFLPSMPRPLRYMFFYQKTIYVMAVTAALAEVSYFN